MLAIYFNFNILEEDYYEIKKNFGRTGGWHTGTRHFWLRRQRESSGYFRTR